MPSRDCEKTDNRHEYEGDNSEMIPLQITLKLTGKARTST